MIRNLLCRFLLLRAAVEMIMRVRRSPSGAAN
jgi:hypothetical protein